MNIRAILAPNPGPFTLTGTQTYILDDSTVIDPGPISEPHIIAICEAAPRLHTILITHRHGDHSPAAVPLKKISGARVIAPRDVLDDSTVNRRVHGGESLDIDGTRIDVIATPGHTSEHVCYLTEDGDLFTGDTVLGTGTTAIFPPDGHMGDYIRSLEKLRALHPRRIYPAHGPIRDDAVALIDEYIAHRLERERQVLEAVASGATNVQQMRAKIYPDLDERLQRAAEIQIRAHLVKLIEEGRVSRDVAGYIAGSA